MKGRSWIVGALLTFVAVLTLLLYGATVVVDCRRAMGGEVDCRVQVRLLGVLPLGAARPISMQRVENTCDPGICVYRYRLGGYDLRSDARERVLAFGDGAGENLTVHYINGLAMAIGLGCVSLPLLVGGSVLLCRVAIPRPER